MMTDEKIKNSSENNLFRNRSVLIISSYPCHLIYRTKIDFHYQELSANFF